MFKFIIGEWKSYIGPVCYFACLLAHVSACLLTFFYIFLLADFSSFFFQDEIMPLFLTLFPFRVCRKNPNTAIFFIISGPRRLWLIILLSSDLRKANKCNGLLYDARCKRIANDIMILSPSSFFFTFISFENCTEYLHCSGSTAHRSHSNLSQTNKPTFFVDTEWARERERETKRVQEKITTWFSCSVWTTRKTKKKVTKNERGSQLNLSNEILKHVCSSDFVVHLMMASEPN